MSTRKVYFPQSDIVQYASDAMVGCPYGESIRSLSKAEMGKLMGTLFESVLVDQFMSLPADITAGYDMILAEYVDKELLFNLMLKNGDTGWEEVTISKISWAHAPIEKEVKVMPPIGELCTMAFDDFYIKFSNAIVGALSRVGAYVNRYAEINHYVDRDMHVVEIGGDIRHRLFREAFGARYVRDGKLR